MTLLQWSLMWVSLFIVHAQFAIVVSGSDGRDWNKASSIVFSTVVAFFVLSLTGANGVY